MGFVVLSVVHWLYFRVWNLDFFNGPCTYIFYAFILKGIYSIGTIGQSIYTVQVERPLGKGMRESNSPPRVRQLV